MTAEWSPPRRDWSLNEVAWLLDVSPSTVKRHVLANAGVIVTDGTPERRPLLVAHDRLGRTGKPGEQRWAVRHVDVVALIGHDLDPPTEPNRPTREAPPVNEPVTPHPASKPKADLSVGPIRCEIRTAAPLTADQWIVIGALADEIRTAAAMLTEPARVAPRPRIVQT